MILLNISKLSTFSMVHLKIMKSTYICRNCNANMSIKMFVLLLNSIQSNIFYIWKCLYQVRYRTVVVHSFGVFCHFILPFHKNTELRVKFKTESPKSNIKTKSSNTSNEYFFIGMLVAKHFIILTTMCY